MKKALEILREYRSLQFGWNDTEKREETSEAIKELEKAMKHKTCEGCKWEQETNLITTKVGDNGDICTLCIRYENLQDNYELKATT